MPRQGAAYVAGSRATGAGGERTWGIVRDLVSLMTRADPARIGVRVIR